MVGLHENWTNTTQCLQQTCLQWLTINLLLQEVNVSPQSLRYIWYPELEIYGLERFGRQRVLKEMSGVRIRKNKSIHYELGYAKTFHIVMWCISFLPHSVSLKRKWQIYYDCSIVIKLISFSYAFYFLFTFIPTSMMDNM